MEDINQVNIMPGESTSSPGMPGEHESTSSPDSLRMKEIDQRLEDTRQHINSFLHQIYQNSNSEPTYDTDDIFDFLIDVKDMISAAKFHLMPLTDDKPKTTKEVQTEISQLTFETEVENIHDIKKNISTRRSKKLKYKAHHFFPEPNMVLGREVYSLVVNVNENILDEVKTIEIEPDVEVLEKIEILNPKKAKKPSRLRKIRSTLKRFRKAVVQPFTACFSCKES